jgi:hypothetical protein
VPNNGLFVISNAMITHPKQQIAVVNVNKIVNEFIKATANKKLSPEKMQKSVEVFGNKL